MKMVAINRHVQRISPSTVGSGGDNEAWPQTPQRRKPQKPAQRTLHIALLKYCLLKKNLVGDVICSQPVSIYEYLSLRYDGVWLCKPTHLAD